MTTHVRFPYHFYLTHLLIRTADNEYVQDEISRMGFASPDGDYLNEFRSDLEAAGLSPEFIVDDTSETEKTLRNTKVYTAFFPDDGFLGAQKLLGDYDVRGAVEHLILGGGMSSVAIAMEINKKFAVSYTKEAIADYTHYFYNRHILTLADWVSYLSTEPDAATKRGALMSPGVARYRAGLDHSFELDTIVGSLKDEVGICLEEARQETDLALRVKILSTLSGTVKRVHDMIDPGERVRAKAMDNLRGVDLIHDDAEETPVDFAELQSRETHDDEDAEGDLTDGMVDGVAS